MANKDELLQHTKEELLEKAAEQDVTGRHSMNKEELAAALADGSSQQELVDELSPSSKETYEGLSEEAKSEADVAADARGPLLLQPQTERIMTGAVSEEHAKEMNKALKNKPKDYTGDVSEAGFDKDGNPVSDQRGDTGRVSVKDNLGEGDDRKLTEVRDTDVIDFPPPVGQRPYDAPVKDGETISVAPSGSGFGTQVTPASIDAHNSGRRGYNQKSVFYTDGLSGGAEHNLERAYETPEYLQSNDPKTRAAGDESLSEAAKEQKTPQENRAAHAVKTRDNE